MKNKRIEKRFMGYGGYELTEVMGGVVIECEFGAVKERETVKYEELMELITIRATKRKTQKMQDYEKERDAVKNHYRNCERTAGGANSLHGGVEKPRSEDKPKNGNWWKSLRNWAKGIGKNRQPDTGLRK